MYLISPALPIGAYAYSQGQEYAVDAGWLKGEEALSHWMAGVMKHSLATTDLPLLIKLHSSWLNNNINNVLKQNQFLRASRETKELLLEDEQLGLGMVRILETHNINDHKIEGLTKPSFVTLFALAGVKWEIELDDLLYGLVWTWLENQVAAATKTVPLGQTQAQKILMKLSDDIPEVIDGAKGISEERIGSGLPGLALASCLHERQYSRLFRS